MSLTRKMLKAMSIEDEKIEQIIEEHAETVNALKAQIQENNDAAGELEKVRKELDDLKSQGGDWEKKYKEVSEALETLKNETNEKEVLGKKKTAYLELLKEAGISESVLDSVLKATKLEDIELDEEGALKNKDALTENIKNEWKGFIVEKNTTGTQTTNPPATSGGEITAEALDKMSMQEYVKARKNM